MNIWLGMEIKMIFHNIFTSLPFSISNKTSYETACNSLKHIETDGCCLSLQLPVDGFQVELWIRSVILRLL